MSKVLVDIELVSIVSEKVTETVDVIETEVSPSEGELDETVGGVVSAAVESTMNEVIVRVLLIFPAESVTLIVQSE